FQAEDGIRDKLVTGVQTCALPISALRFEYRPVRAWFQPTYSPCTASEADRARNLSRIALKCRPVSKFLEVTEAEARFSFRERGRSEERRVGKECRAGWWPSG